MNEPYTYREAFSTESEAQNFIYTLIGGGIIQKQENLWHVWQINF
jgi:hypothetical protein